MYICKVSVEFGIYMISSVLFISKYPSNFPLTIDFLFLSPHPGKCPVTSSPLSVEDLLPVQSNNAVRPRPLEGATFPGLLTQLKSEWDEVMLETFALKQALDTTRRELSQTLYQHDAACRVIARLMQEKAELTAMLNGAVPMSNKEETDRSASEMDVDTTSSILPEALAASVASAHERLSTARKGAKFPSLLPKGRLQQVNEEATETAASHLDKTGKAKGLTACSAGLDGVVVGAVDTNIYMISATQGGGIDTTKCKAHKKAVTSTDVLADGRLACGAVDGTVKLFMKTDNGLKVQSTCTDMADAIVAVAIHPSQSIIVAFTSSTYAVISTEETDGHVIYTNPSSDLDVSLTCGAIHPDGVLIGAGTTTGGVILWNLRTGKIEKNIEFSGGAAGGLTFSENGYLAALSRSDGTATTLDLRDGTFKHPLPAGSGQNVAFDASGKYLASGGRVNHGKTWDQGYATTTGENGNDNLVAQSWLPDAAGVLLVMRDGSASIVHFA